MRRILSTLLGLSLITAGLGTVAVAAPAQATPTGLAWSGDYATEELGDPWDFSNPEDWDPLARTESPGITGSVTGGMLAFDQTSPFGGVLIGSARYGEDSLPWGRSTWLRPINTNTYRRLSFRMYQPSKPDVGGVHLLTCGVTAGGCEIPLNFFPDAGWHTYTLDLPAGHNVYSIFIIPGPGQRTGFQLDWVRVTRDGGQVESPAAGVEPVPVVLDPDRGGGADYATVVRGKAWTFDDGSDVASVYDLNGVNHSGGAFRGCNADGQNDPAVALAMGAPLDTNVYNRLTARVWYDGAFGLADARGGGMMARLMWHTVGTGGYQVSQDIVVFPGWNDIDLELRTLNPALVTEPDIGRTAGWVGMVDEIRFDFHEDRGARCVALDSLAIRAADTASPSFPIRFRDDALGTGAPAAGTTAEIFLDPGNGTYGGAQIASGVPVTSGDNVFTWNGRGVGPGTYWVWVRLTNPAGRQSSAYARGPLVFAGVRPLASRTVTSVASGAPDGTSAVLANLTMTEAETEGYITANVCEAFGNGSPATSNGNFTPGQNIANLGVVPVAGDERFCLFNHAPVHLIADAQGSFSPNGDLRFAPFGPTRVLDTRANGGARPETGTITRVATGLPAGAAAALVNLTMTEGLADGFVTANVCSAFQGPPSSSNGNYVPNRSIANLAVVPIDGDGSFCVYTHSPVHVVVDVQGYFASGAPLAFTLVAPDRVLDTRVSGRPGAGGVVRVNPRVAPGTDAVLVNLTMTEAATTGYITADRCSVLAPGPQAKSNGNFTPRQHLANLSVVPLDPDGSFCVFTQQPVDVVVDVQGTFTAGGPLRFTATAPDRRIDTRNP